MTDEEYIPDRSDLVWLDFTPQAGHRPALVISPAIYNEKSSLALFCPITRQKKGYPFEVPIPASSSISGVILTDQIKSLDWTASQARFIDQLPEDPFSTVIAKLDTLIHPEGT